ncbi:MAG: hypothetical protein GXP24_07635 [Planctomycetes bacterium]|nr:hypothetical protein [Planctomycetota bacterium]
MRLTLRTLLAYMDDILEPADHEDLGSKIEASDFASELIHRSRDTVRRLRLGAPAVLSAGSDDVMDTVDLGDANSVAEYLDNTLPPEQVADFERMCLEPGTEPDMHLAEVASCHHVLTMVLGEPAEIDAGLKSRMYQLPARLANGQKLRIEPAHVAPQEAPPVQAATSTAPPTATPLAQPASLAEHELPDYLREAAASKRRSRRWAIASTLFVIVAITGVWFATAPEAELPSDLSKVDISAFDDGEIAIEGLGDASSDATAGGESTMTTAPPFIPEVPPASDAPVEPADPSRSLDAESPVTSVPSTTELGNINLSGAASGESRGDSGPSADAVAPTIEPEKEIFGEVAESETTTTAAATSPDSVLPVPSIPSSGESDTGAEEPVLVASADKLMTEDSTATPEATVPSEEPAAPQPTVPQPLGPQRLGNYLGNNDLLLIYNARQDKWIRMPPRSPISTGDVLLTLPKFRTHVVLADVNTYLSGGTRLHIPLENFDTVASDTELCLEMIYGRLLLNAGLKGSQIAMQADDQLREFRLASSASLAVEVERVFVPGTDYENVAASIKATWYLTSGSVQWPTAAGGTQTIQAPAMWKTIDGFDEIPERIEELPAWVDREQVTDVERRARNNIAEELTAGQPVGIRLLELTDGKGLGRQKEVRILAAAASVFVGEFEPLVKTLNDREQNRAWETHIQELRQALALSPDVASRVRQAFVNIRGEEAAQDLMEMVVGYNAQQIGESREAIQAGALVRLIRWLDHDSLDYRVLAIFNIREITGRYKGYRPDDTSKRRKIQLRKIWDAFEAYELMPKKS